jgi:hypothetical protein
MAFGEVKSGPRVWWYEATRLVRSRLAARVSHILVLVTGYFLTSLNAGKRHGKVEV